MNMIERNWVSPEDMRSDIHPLAVLDTQDPIRECAGCGLPVPVGIHNIYCSEPCEDRALEEALLINAIEEAKAKDDIFGQLFPEIAMLPDCDPFIDCSCGH